MPLYEWACPKCQKVTSVINRMTESDKTPEKCEPQAERLDKLDADGKPTYKKHESCGYEGTEGWKKLIGSTNFVINGYSFKNGYGSNW